MKIKNLIYVYLFTMIVLMATVNKCFARINVYGLISSDTTWTAESSPYNITGNVLVNEGVTLTIEPGVVVQFDKDKCLHINGTLLARGTNSRRITFTKNTSDNWGYILFNDSSADAIYDKNGNYTTGSILEYCTVEYAKSAKSDKGAVSIDHAHPFINFCKIQNNETTGIRSINLSNTLKITNCFISGNNGGGIYCSGGIIVISDNYIGNNRKGGISCIYSKNTITNNIISNNITSSDGGGIYCNGGISDVSQNVIANNKAAVGGGVYISGSSGKSDNIINISQNIIANNKAEVGGGIRIYASRGKIYKNTINNNTSVGSGIYIEKGGNIVFENNLLTNNYHKESSSAWSKASSSLHIKASSPVINYNNIFDNSTSYALYNDNSYGTSTVNAKHNWWGVSQDAGVQSLIFDWVDNTKYGFVDYAPFENNILTEPPISPPRIAKITTTDNKEILITWSPNKEPDTAGYKVYWDTDAGFPYRNSVDVGTQTSYIIKDWEADICFVTVTAYDSQYKPGNDSQNTNINENQTNGNESWFAEKQTIIFAERLIGTWSGEVNNKPATLHIYRQGGKMIYGGVEEILDLSLEFKNNEVSALTLKGILYNRLDGSKKSFSLNTFYMTSLNMNTGYMEGYFKGTRGNKGKWSVYKKMGSVAKTAITPPDTITTGRRLGISAKNLSPALAKSLNTNITEGIVVDDIHDGSPAKEAGFECNDILITFDEKPVSNVEQLKELVDQAELGKQINVVVLRNDSEKILTLSMGEQIVNSNEIAQEVPRDAVATVEKKKQITFAELISGEKDASFFDSHYSKFNYEYDDVWEAVNYVLNKQKEKIITADKESGVIITDTCKRSMNRKYYKYYILIEKTDETTAKLNLKLIAHNSNWNSNLKRSVLKPMNRTFVNDKYVKKFIYEVREKLGDKK